MARFTALEYSILDPAPQGVHTNHLESAVVHNDHNNLPEDIDFKPTKGAYLSLIALAVLSLMVAMDGTSISVAMPIIAQDLNASAIETFWLGTSFLLTSTVTQPVYASLSYIFGRKPLLLIAIAFFLIGTLVGGTAKNITTALVGRSIQGAGGGAINGLVGIILTDLLPLRVRPKWFGVVAAMWSIGSVTGPVIGGAFSQNVSWRWLFYINLPFIVVGAVIVLLYLHLDLPPSSTAAKFRRIDWLGAAVFMGSTTSLLIPLTWGGIMYAWTSWRTLVPLMVGVLGLLGFVLCERYFASEPLIPPRIFRNRTVILIYAVDVWFGLILWTLLYYMPLFFEAVKGYSPILAGVALFPDTFTVAPMAVVTGLVISKTGRYRWMLPPGWMFVTFGLGLMILLSVDTAVPAWIFLTIVPGVGLGIVLPVMQTGLQAASRNEDMGYAIATFSFFRTFGQAVGIAVGGVIFQSRLKKNLATFPSFAARSTELAKDAAALVQVINALPPGQDKLDLRTAYVESLRTVLIVLCSLSGVAFGISFLIKSYDLDRDLETDQGYKRASTSPALMEQRLPGSYYLSLDSGITNADGTFLNPQLLWRANSSLRNSRWTPYHAQPGFDRERRPTLSSLSESSLRGESSVSSMSDTISSPHATVFKIARKPLPKTASIYRLYEQIEGRN